MMIIINNHGKRRVFGTPYGSHISIRVRQNYYFDIWRSQTLIHSNKCQRKLVKYNKCVNLKLLNEYQHDWQSLKARKNYLDLIVMKPYYSNWGTLLTWSIRVIFQSTDFSNNENARDSFLLHCNPFHHHHLKSVGGSLTISNGSEGVARIWVICVCHQTLSWLIAVCIHLRPPSTCFRLPSIDWNVPSLRKSLKTNDVVLLLKTPPCSRIINKSSPELIILLGN